METSDARTHPDRAEASSRVAVVTGAGAGLGRAVARELAGLGHDVGLLGRDADRLHAARKEIESMGRRAHVVTVDVADAEAMRESADAVEAVLGPVDAWVNNAMASVLSEIDQLRPEEVRRVTEVTYLGTVHGTMAILPRMRERDRGVIAQVGSALAYQAIPLQAPYCAAKHAARSFTTSLRCELLHQGSGVKVTQVHVPALNTPQFTWSRSRLPRRPQPVPPIFQPEVAARAVAWAAANGNRREVFVGGSTVLTVLGSAFAPGLMDRYLARNGYAGQQTDEPDDPERPDNLFTPVGGDVGARGPFDDRARARSRYPYRVRWPAWAGGALVAAGALAARRR